MILALAEGSCTDLMIKNIGFGGVYSVEFWDIVDDKSLGFVHTGQTNGLGKWIFMSSICFELLSCHR